jgi:hypothetical protein
LNGAARRLHGLVRDTLGTPDRPPVVRIERNQPPIAFLLQIKSAVSDILLPAYPYPSAASLVSLNHGAISPMLARMLRPNAVGWHSLK